MKLLKKIGIGILGAAIGIGCMAASYTFAAPFSVGVGGTGTTTPSGILYGTNSASTPLQTVSIGANLTFTGGVLSATGGGGSSTFGTTSITATSPLSWNTTTANMSISQAGPSSDGYLSSTNWNSFNSRLSTSSLSLIDKGFFFSTTSANYWLTQQIIPSFSTTSANYWASLGLAFSTSSANYWGSTKGYATFGYPFPNNATTTVLSFINGLISNASTTLTYLAGTPAGSFLAVDPTGKIIATSTPISGTGSVGNWFTPTTNFGALANSTSTPIWFQAGLQASSTIEATNIDIDQYSSINKAGVILAYASSTNFDTSFGLSAGGQNSTTSPTIALNTAIGFHALLANTTAIHNTVVGGVSGPDLTTGRDNTAVGENTMEGTQTATRNTVVGSQSGSSGNAWTGTGNTLLGYAIGGNFSATQVDYNTIVGYENGANLSRGYGNTLIGSSPDLSAVSSGSGNIGIGYNVNFKSNTSNLQLNIGNLLYGTLPATTTSFTANQTGGLLGVGSSSPTKILSVGSNNAGTFAIATSTAGCAQFGGNGELFSTGTNCSSSTGSVDNWFTPSSFGTSASNATSTLIGFNQGLYASATSTIGNGTQTGGLTVNGGATTTLNQIIFGTTFALSGLYFDNTSLQGITADSLDLFFHIQGGTGFTITRTGSGQYTYGGTSGGNGTVYMQNFGSNNTASTPQYSFGADTGTGIFQNITMNGAHTLGITSNGNVTALFNSASSTITSPLTIVGEASSTGLFVGTSTYTGFSSDPVSGKVGIGCVNTSSAKITIGCGSNVNVNPNINPLITDPSDARYGVSVNNAGVFTKALGEGLYAYDYTAGAPLPLTLQEFGSQVNIGTTATGANLLVNGTASTTALTISSIPSCSGSNALTTNSSGVVACGAISGGTGSVGNWFTPVSYGNATSTTIGFNLGLLSVGSTTINGILHLPLTNGGLAVNGGAVYSTPTTTLSAGTNITLTPSGNNIQIAASGGGSGQSPYSWVVTAAGTGDFTTIQPALDRCGVVGGGNIILTDANYNIGSTGLLWKGSNCAIWGRGPGTTTIAFTGATTAIKTNTPASNFEMDEIHNVFFSGPSNTTSVAINWSDMSHGIVDGVQTSGVGTSILLNDTQNVTFYNSFTNINANDNHAFCINASSTNPVNGNYFNNIFCGDAATANVVGLNLNNGNGNTFNNIFIEPGTVTGTQGINIFDNKLASNNGVFNNTFSNWYIEANSIGVKIATTQNPAAGGIQRNTFSNMTVEANTTDWNVTPAAIALNTINGYDSNFGVPLTTLQGPVGISTSTELLSIGNIPYAQFAVQASSTQSANAFAVGSYSGLPFLLVNNAGNVGLGSTSPYATLSVNAAAQTNPYFSIGSSTSELFKVAPASTLAVGIGTTTPWRTFSLVGTAAINGLTNANTGDYVCINTSTFELEMNTATCSLSSRIYKNNIQPLTGSLSKILQLRPVTFEYNVLSGKDTTKENMGLIAEEVQPILPDAVTHDSTGKVAALDWNQLISPVIESIQELYTSIQKLISRVSGDEKKIDALQAQVNTLNTRLDALEKK